MVRRLYSAVSVSAGDGGFAIALDARPLLTPGRRPLRVPTLALAEALAGEWREQGEMIRPDSMPLNQLANTAIDRVEPERPAIIEGLLGYGGSDLLCYRAGEPRELVERQDRLWQPVVDWAAAELGAELRLTTGVLPQPQPAAALARLRALVGSLDLWPLTALQSAVAATGSLLLGLALVKGKLDAAAVHQASQLDELYQAERWGEDDEAVARRDALAGQVAAAETLLVFARQ